MLPDRRCGGSAGRRERMKHDPMCKACAKDCKQPATAKLVSCPHFERADRNLDMFDMQGGIQKSISEKSKQARKKK